MWNASDEALIAGVMPAFVEKDGRRTDEVVLACTHYPFLLPLLEKLAPWPVEWIDPAPAIARRVSDLLGQRIGSGVQSGAEMIFTSNRVHGLGATLTPFFGGRALA